MRAIRAEDWNYPIKVACFRFYTLKGQTPLVCLLGNFYHMLHSSGLGREAIMLPHQTRNVFLSWFLIHYITLGILAGNLRPPESLEKRISLSSRAEHVVFVEFA